MGELRKFYTSSVTTLAVLVALFMLFFPQTIIPGVRVWLPSHPIIHTIADNIPSRIFILILFLAGEKLIRTRIWKWWHPELDLSGNWVGTTTYLKAHLGTPALPFTAKHAASFEQDCLHLNLVPTHSEDYLNWGALSTTLEDKDKLHYAYWVNYRGAKPFPERAKGIEELRVVERDKKGRPLRMTGEFYHCALGLEPVFSGTVDFIRQPKTRK